MLHESNILPDRHRHNSSRKQVTNKGKKLRTSCAIRFWRTGALRARNGSLQCSAGPERHGCHGIDDTMARAGHIVGSRWVPRSNKSNYSIGHSHFSFNSSRGKCAAIHLHALAHRRQRRGVSATDVILNKASDCTVANSVSRRAQYPLDSWSSDLVASLINMKLTPDIIVPGHRAHAFKHLYQNTKLAVDTGGERLLLVWDRCVLLDKLGRDPPSVPSTFRFE